MKEAKAAIQAAKKLSMTSEEIKQMHEILLQRAKLTPEKSKAAPSKYYGDPANHVKFQGETMDVDDLRHAMENWMRWALSRDYMPASTRCPLGYLYKATDVWQSSEPYRPPVDGIAAVRLEKIIVGLPERHRQAIVMHYLNKAAINGQVRIIKGRDDRAAILGVQKSRYHEMVNQARSMIWRKLTQMDNG